MLGEGCSDYLRGLADTLTLMRLNVARVIAYLGSFVDLGRYLTEDCYSFFAFITSLSLHMGLSKNEPPLQIQICFDMASKYALISLERLITFPCDSTLTN